MFGYVKPVPAELLVREYDFYRAVSCGICRCMRRYTGRLSALSLTYDSVFCALVRMMLSDESCRSGRCRCAVHPCRGKHCVQENPTLVYTARAFAVLAYGKYCDERADRRGLSRIPLWFAGPVLRHAARRAAMPELLTGMQEELHRLHRLEAENCASVDCVADCSGRLLSRFFSQDLPAGKQKIASDIGFHLGRFIAVADAAEDLEADIRQSNYNPLHAAGNTELNENLRARLHASLTMELSMLEEGLQCLPLAQYAAAGNILKNIVCLGLPERIRFLVSGKDPQGETI